MVTNEQLALIRRLKETQSIARHELEERDQLLAEKMTSTGLLDRNYDESTETVIYSLPTR